MTMPLIPVAIFCSVLGATLGSMTTLVVKRPESLGPMPVTAEELEKTRIILEFAERNCAKRGPQIRVEGSGAYVSATCGPR